ncbi:glycosyltransferase family 4 protein [Halobaculum rubrum]|uniref:glycosyltransferase family 4 protein n=1 Tax=Halobaculum rubrum TaxID=2872158 RepID=UPI001CA41138|nr:glycosyltransferase family 4 protein [Halobaculum rubrum]QZX99900.1 glycosyltransferase family 4 protein [Halobaculum rubrum]
MSVPGTFWAFRIAEAVADRGGDVVVFTSEPAFVRSTDSGQATVRTIRHPFLVEQVGHQVPWPDRLVGFTGLNRPFQRWGAYLFDRAVARNLRAERAANGLFLGFAGACRDSLRRANDLGYTTAVERSSTHIRTQRELLRAEYERFGATGQPISERHVEREEQEYVAADYVVTPSEFTVESFRDQGVDAEKLVRIPFGTDVDFEPPTRGGEDTVTFLFVGHVSLRKGIQYLLPAWKQLEHPDAELVVAGRIDDAVADIVAEYADDSIRFEGWVDDMAALYREASALVLPTLEEGSARVTYEAMAWALPVVTTSHSGWVGTDGEHGFWVPIRDPEALADAMARLCADADLRRRLGENGRALVEREYTWADYGERVWRAYREMVGTKD